MTVRRTGGPAVTRLTTALRSLDGVQGKTGYFETAKYPNGTPVAYVATIHEFGDPESGIPARPTMRPTVAEKRDEWIKLLGEGAKSVLAGQHTAVQVVELVALRAAGDVAKAISELRSPPLKEATIRAKKSDKPLVDTGQMIQSITGVAERTK